MRAAFTFDYGATLDEAQIEALNAVLDKPVQLKDDGEVKTYERYVADLTEVLPIIGQSARVMVAGMADPNPVLDLAVAVREMHSRLIGLPTAPENYVNNKVDVHVPGNSLLFVNEVRVEEDLCTDALRELLEEGWRIVAVCPQPDQRRPDYVLGRHNREEER